MSDLGKEVFEKVETWFSSSKVMPWLECKKHPSVYYDSAFHKKCSDCSIGILEVAKKFVLLAFDNYRYGSVLLDWIRFGLELLQPTRMNKEEVISKRESADKNLSEIRETITKELQEMLQLCKDGKFKVETLESLPEDRIELILLGSDNQGDF